MLPVLYKYDFHFKIFIYIISHYFFFVILVNSLLLSQFNCFSFNVIWVMFSLLLS